MKQNLGTKSLIIALAVVLIFSQVCGMQVKAEETDSVYSGVVVAEQTESGTWGNLSVGQGRNSRISPRAVELKYQTGEYAKYNGYMFVTMEYGVPDNLAHPNETVFPIYVSADGGLTWDRNQAASGAVDSTVFPDIHNQNTGTNPIVECMANCPQLFELPGQLGSFPAGTVVCAGIATKKDLSTSSLDFYISDDACHSWDFTSVIDTGGWNYVGNDTIWEPFFVYENGNHEGNENDHQPMLICFYSDENDTAHSQKLIYRYTTDGINWSAACEVVVFEEQAQRPGMPVVAKMANGKYIMVYEGYGIVDLPNNYKFSLDDCALNWNAGEVGKTFGYGGSPYVEVMDDGTIVASGAGSSVLYLNTEVDGSGQWIEIASPVANSYNRQILKLENGNLFVINGGWHGGNNAVICGTTKVSLEAATLNSDARYITNAESGNAICTWDNSLAENADIVQWDQANAAHFFWTLVLDSASGFYKIVNPASGYVLTADTSTVSSALSLKQYTGASTQLWEIEEITTGQYTIFLANTDFVIDAQAAPTGWNLSDYALYLSSYNATSSTQRWTMSYVNTQPSEVTISVEVSGGNCTVIPAVQTVWAGMDQYFVANPENGYSIKSVTIKTGSGTLRQDSATSRHFGVQNITTDLTLLVEVEGANSATNQSAILIGDSTNSNYICMIQNTSSDGAQLIEWSLESGMGFRWNMEAVEGTNNQYRFVSLNGGNVISASNGQVIQASRNNSDNNQIWVVAPYEQTGMFTLTNLGTGELLTSNGGKDTNPITSTARANRSGQVWNIDCLLIFDANGGSVTDGLLTISRDTTITTLPTPVRDGYTFLGWYTAATGGTKIEVGSTLNCSYTLFAHWE